MSDSEERAVVSAESKLPSVGMDARGVNLKDIAEAERFCRLVVASGLAPKSLNTPAKVFVAVETGMEAGLSPMQSLQSVYVVNGMPAWTGQGALALIYASGSCSIPPKITFDGDGDSYKAVVTFQRKESPVATVVSFSVADAKRAHLWGKAGPWTDYADDMLMWRAVGRMAKRYFADVLKGLSIAEEVRDYPRQEVTIERDDPPMGPDPLLSGVKATGEVGEEPELDPETGEIIPSYIGREEQGRMV